MVTISYFGMPGQGRTITEAKKDAGAKITRALDHDYTPTLLSYRGIQCLIWRTPEGICSCLPDTGKITGRTFHYSDNMAHVVEQQWFHLAQLGWDGKETEPEMLPAEYRSQFKSWVRFQLRYTEARSQGKSDTEAHQYACTA